RPALLFLLAGLGIALWNVRRSPYRALLAAVLAAPAGAALVGLGVTRALFMVVPAALLTALGLHAALEKLSGWLARTAAELGLTRPEPLRLALTGLVFLALAGANLAMLRDALVNGPLWFREYDLGGLQYGARQLFPAVEAYLEDHPAAKVLVSPTWANGTDVLARFFSGDPLPYQLGSITGYQDRYTPIDPEQVFVMTPAEFELASADPKFAGLQVERTLPYPDGRPGFTFVRLHYSEAAPALYAAESQARRRLARGEAVLPDFTPVQAAYSALDMGQIQDVFDGDPFTLIRTAEANPLQLTVEFPAPRALTAVEVRVGGTPTLVVVRACPPGTNSCLEQSVEVGETPHPREVLVEFATPVTADRVAVDVLSVRDGEPAHVHLWEVTFR
ncbi:MAG TPA: hypothetical protein VFF68_07225, partial [Anaerolineaceae bacterium]|nr:hypothetical protein [Anaerolineaceae bacterium]